MMIRIKNKKKDKNKRYHAIPNKIIDSHSPNEVAPFSFWKIRKIQEITAHFPCPP